MGEEFGGVESFREHDEAVMSPSRAGKGCAGKRLCTGQAKASPRTCERTKGDPEWLDNLILVAKGSPLPSEYW